MSTVPTVRDALTQQDPDSPGRWQDFQQRVSQEVKGVKWTAAMPDLASKIGELFDVPIPGLLTASWKKADVLQQRLKESEKSPEEVIYVELADHTIQSEHHPYIEVRLQNAPVKKIQFTLKLSFRLKGFVLKLQAGQIREIQTGACELAGSIQFQGVTVIEKKPSPIKLPGSIPVDEKAEAPAAASKARDVSDTIS